MKKMKHFISFMLAMVMVLAMSMSAMAASITITRDNSYNGTTDGDGREYSYYKVFTASYADGFSQEFEGGHNSGAPNTSQGNEKVSYTATAAVAAKLALEGNIWFDVQDISGSTDKIITWKDGVNVDAETVQAAAEWLIDNGAYESGPTKMKFENTKWTSGEIASGYYVIASDTGKNFTAVTTDIEIYEKNDYPQMDKTQADEDNTTQRDEEVVVAVGDVVTYQAKITIPKAAKVGDTIVVTDTPSAGLSYNGDVAVSSNEGNATVEFKTGEDGIAWTATITVTERSQGKDVIFGYTMTITADALVDTGRVNTLNLTYGDNYTAIPDSVTYTTYFSGIEKIDGDDQTKLVGVKFTLKEAGNEFKVSKHADGYYVPDATNGFSEVITDANGLIQIRGLDNDKTYTLTEIETLPGYNMLEEDVTLVLVKDEGSAFADHNNNNDYADVVNNKGTVLPSTGGIGTTMFYVIGGALVLVAVVLLVTRKRMSVEK